MKPITSMLFAILILTSTALAGCQGPDFTPVYFPPPAGQEGTDNKPQQDLGKMQCALNFTSQLCVAIKGDKLEVGTGNSEPLCAEVPAFPIHVSGGTATINGNEFPELSVEGHGLPVPIKINAKGDGDGADNVGTGTIDSAGNITIKNFSLYIVALGIVGKVPNLTLTTGSTDEFPSLPALTGSPPDASGAMTLVTGTVLGHIIDAADEYLMGASLTATFKGSIAPPLSQCGGQSEKSIEVKKVSVTGDGKQTESDIPDGNILEVSEGTYIAETSSDVGASFETTANFRVKNIGTKEQSIDIPARKGAFYLNSATPLTGKLSPQQTIMLSVTFRPTQQGTPAGKVIEAIAIGADQFSLTAVALSKGGKGSVSVVGDDGKVTAPNVGDVTVGDAAVPANAERRFFLCKETKCADAKAYTSCQDCADPTTMPCELLQVSTDGRPMAEVDASCKPVNPKATPMYTIDLAGSGGVTLSAEKQVLAIRNMGVKQITITSISIEETPGSKSTGQFALPDGALFVADNFADIQKQVSDAIKNNKGQGTKLPVTLPPYQPGYKETTAYIVVTYTPNDLLGSDGTQAGVGSKAVDKAVLKITTDTGNISAEISGTTTIKESPSLELYFKTASGTKQVADGQAFPIKGITDKTVDLAVPMFLRIADTSSSSMRITSIAISGDDAANFKWLDTKEKIAAVNPGEGKGKRCSIPIVDEKTGEMKSESFDLNPVSIAPPGFDINPGAYSTTTMPLFGCVDFHRDDTSDTKKRIYEAALSVEAVELSATGVPAQNPDGSPRKGTLTARVLGAINPRTGKFVLRITQTMAGILNPQFPALSAVSSRQDLSSALAAGKVKETDLQVFSSAIILDPFDEATIKTADGKKTLSIPNDGTTAIFRRVDTHPASKDYDDEFLFDYASLIYDGGQPVGSRGVFEDYPNVPEGARQNGWRIFTSSLSYPGPLGPPEKKPDNPSDCVIINPCDQEGLKLFTDAGAAAKGKGACAFFYASGGRYDSPAFHSAADMDGGDLAPVCSRVDQPQKLIDIDTGRYSVDGELVFEEVGMRFFGPTYFSTFFSKPPMDAIFHMAFTTGMLKLQATPNDPNVLPDKAIDLAKNEFKINLNDKTMSSPAICDTNTQNRVVDGKRYSTWHFLDGLLFKDEEGKTPAGCPEEGNGFNGGQAFLRGRDIDPQTGIFTVVSAAKFGSSDDLTLAFKDVMLFIVLNGWICDPDGKPEEFEGSRCFDTKLNDRDAASQTSIVK